MPHTLRAMLAPESIAIVGASADSQKRGYQAITGLLDANYAGRIYPVHPKLDTLLGLTVYPSVKDLPEPVDLVVICIPASACQQVIADCQQNHSKGAIILASGFGESGEQGKALEAQLSQQLAEGKTRLIGPNTSGFFNLHNNTDLLGLPEIHPGSVGIISQSGNMLLAMVCAARQYPHSGFSVYVGPGNQTDLDFADYLGFLEAEANTRVALFYVEGFRDGRRFLQKAAEISRNMPVVVYKSGSTQAGKQSASSHTGALAGDYRLTVDVLRQSGISVITRSDEIYPVSMGLACYGHAQGKRVAILADGGGQATIAADRIAEAHLEVATLPDQTQQQLKALLFPQASTVNPVDVAGSSDANPMVLAKCIDILLACPEVDVVLMVGMFGGYAERFDQTLADNELKTARHIAASCKTNSKPVVIHSLYDGLNAPALDILKTADIPVYSSIEYAVALIKAQVQRGQFLTSHRGKASNSALTHSEPLLKLLQQRADKNQPLLETEAKQLLREHGVDIPREFLITDENELAQLGDQTDTVSWAMKVVSTDILHKSDAGGVMLNLKGKDTLASALRQIYRNGYTYNKDADIEGVLLAPMAAKGVEVIIGIVRDQAFGPVIMLGLGGIFTEIIADVAFRSVPVDESEAASMLEQLTGKAMFEGFRGAPPIDKAVLISLLVNISQIADSYPEIREMDLNPVICHPEGLTIVDARIIPEQQTA